MPARPTLSSWASGSRALTPSLARSAVPSPLAATTHLRPSLATLPPTTTTRAARSIGSIAPEHVRSRFNYGAHLPVLGASHTGALARKTWNIPERTGALATKKGMTALYDAATGERTPCTVLQMDRCEVVGTKRRDRHGYWAVQVGAGWKHESNVSRPMLGHWSNLGVSPKRFVSEFRVAGEGGMLDVGSIITPEWFVVGQFVDARSVSHGKGFAGGMKRWGFGGQPASHGQSLMHRGMGSSGGSQGSGSRVLPGKKMPGRMGGHRVTIQNLKVMHVDAANGIVVVSGAVGGPKGCIVQIQDALKKPWPVIPEANAAAATAAA
ncbi:uncharacterized protein K452DRAFT_287026 [Aplosporella prunicola CBS 121167]|uniref:Large ribosomal subunit protein uL3m n=1 Tax=Aplosporella prunicola CBS 121167 TaxID=1176127 RepID=A0A6A6BH62_9PEZI|nr:uncharacterized protein K452DRAFT_287026 [Aplosporella prunicola CBS 121167]KAF2142604.1 hypothetical protein K452DRAFT_287026 [Aplosporella prunicola CBS 121167]